jgi:hypothetical protein
MKAKLADFEKELLAKEVSLKKTKGVNVFKGSSYNGKGKVDNSKIRSNKKRKK